MPMYVSLHTKPQHANYNMKLKISSDKKSAHYNPTSNLFNHMQIIHQLKIDLRLICNRNTIKQFASTVLQNTAFYFFLLFEIRLFTLNSYFGFILLLVGQQQPH